MCARVLLCFVVLLPGAHAEVIDRIAVTLDNQVITQSEILREMRLTAFLNGDPLDLSGESRKKAAGRLIEQKLIRKEIEAPQYLEVTGSVGLLNVDTKTTATDLLRNGVQRQPCGYLWDDPCPLPTTLRRCIRRHQGDNQARDRTSLAEAPLG